MSVCNNTGSFMYSRGESGSSWADSQTTVLYAMPVCVCLSFQQYVGMYICDVEFLGHWDKKEILVGIVRGLL